MIVEKQSFGETAVPLGQRRAWRRPIWALLAVVASVAANVIVKAGDERQTAPPERPQGLVFAGAVNLPEKDTFLQAELFLPRGTAKIQGVVVILHHGDLSSQLFYNAEFRRMVAQAGCVAVLTSVRHMQGPQPNRPIEAEVIRNAAAGGGEGVILLLDQLARSTSHHELGSAPILFWGFSAAASFGTTFAGLHPDRTVGFVRYHTHRRGLPASVGALTQLPALLIAGGQDQGAGFEDAETMWRTGRAADAPWTFALEPEAGHASPEIHEVTARELTIPWMAAVLRQRLSSTGPLRVIGAAGSWLADPRTGDVAPAAAFVGDPRAANWLPDERSAQGWQRIVRSNVRLP